MCYHRLLRQNGSSDKNVYIKYICLSSICLWSVIIRPTTNRLQRCCREKCRNGGELIEDIVGCKKRERGRIYGLPKFFQYPLLYIFISPKNRQQLHRRRHKRAQTQTQ